MSDSDFSRRRRKRRVVIAAIGAITAMLLSSGRAAQLPLEKELVVVATGGVFEQLMKEHFYEPFSRSTGVTVRPVASLYSEAWTKVKAMSEVGKVEWDIISPAVDDFLDPERRRLLYDLGDCGVLPNVATYGVPGTCRQYGVLRTIGGTVIVYDTRRFPPGKHPRSWADFWDVKRFPGPRAMLNSGTIWVNLMAALLADGVLPDTLFPMDVDRAFRKLDQLKPYVKVWWKTGDQSQQVIRDGEVVMAMMWSGRALSLKSAGVPIEVEWNEAFRDVGVWAMLRHAPHPKAALAFLNFFMDRPEAHVAFARKMFYDTPNRAALELLPEAERRTRGTFGPNWDRMVEIDNEWVAKNRARLVERWSAWLAN